MAAASWQQESVVILKNLTISCYQLIIDFQLFFLQLCDTCLLIPDKQFEKYFFRNNRSWKRFRSCVRTCQLQKALDLRTFTGITLAMKTNLKQTKWLLVLTSSNFYFLGRKVHAFTPPFFVTQFDINKNGTNCGLRKKRLCFWVIV